jgi:hypothetical protein
MEQLGDHGEQKVGYNLKARGLKRDNASPRASYELTSLFGWRSDGPE